MLLPGDWKTAVVRPHCVAALLPKEKMQRGNEGRTLEEKATSEGGGRSASCLLDTGPEDSGRGLACRCHSQTCSWSALGNDAASLLVQKIARMHF